MEDDDIEDTNREFKNAITCKILTTKIINPYVFSDIMSRIWRIEGAVKVEKAGTNVFLCKFKRMRDKIRIIKGGPWIYGDAILIFDEPRGNCSVEALEFKYVSFWIISITYRVFAFAGNMPWCLETQLVRLKLRSRTKMRK